jgi:hypothetical protein
MCPTPLGSDALIESNIFERAARHEPLRFRVVARHQVRLRSQRTIPRRRAAELRSASICPRIGRVGTA